MLARVRVFLSHSSLNKEHTIAAADHLECCGHDVWLDATDIRAGRLLRNELLGAIAESDAVVVCWSEPASRSRWCRAEVLASYLNRRPMVVVPFDDSIIPALLSAATRVDFDPDRWLDDLSDTLVPALSFKAVPTSEASSPETLQWSDRVGAEQYRIRALADAGRLAAAKRANAVLRDLIDVARDRFDGAPEYQVLLGYQLKNTYQLTCWEAQGAPRPPSDPLLLDAESLFFDAVFQSPNDLEALNGLGSVLLTEREADAAVGVIEKAIELAAMLRIEYGAAVGDLEMARELQRDRLRLSQRLRSFADLGAGAGDAPLRHRTETALLVAPRDRQHEFVCRVTDAASAEQLNMHAITFDSSVDDVVDHLARSRRVVLAWSRNAASDDDHRTALLLTLLKGTSLIAVQLDDHPLPDILKPLLTVSAQRDADGEIATLLRALTARGSPSPEVAVEADWEPDALASLRRDCESALATRADARQLAPLRARAARARRRWAGFPGAHHSAATIELALAQRAGRAKRSRLLTARTFTLDALLLDPTDASALARLATVLSELSVPLADVFQHMAAWAAELDRGENA